MRNFANSKFAKICGLVLAAMLPTAAMADGFAAATTIDDQNNDAELSFEWCRRSTLRGAKDCALEACDIAAGDCQLVIYCEPGKWSGVLAMSTGDDIKHTAVCEKASRNSALRALKDQCRAFRKAHADSFKNCKVESIVSPNAGTSETDVVTLRYRGGDIRAVD